MKKLKEFILIRYIMIAAILFQLIVNHKDMSTLAVIIMGLFIVNNQLRLFYFKDNLGYISVALEIILAFLAYILYSGELILYLMPCILDCFILLKVKYSKWFVGIIAAVIFVMSLAYGQDKIVMNLVYTSTIIILLFYVSNENKEKVNAQALYDELRVKEEELKKANINLENYASSIEELTLLKERNRISREIHDSVGHALSTAMIQLGAMERMASKENSHLEPMAKNLREFINDSLQDVRRAVKELKPIEYSSFEGIFKIEEISKNFSSLTGVEVDFKIAGTPWGMSSKQTSNIYRIVQEGFSNSLKHGNATRIKLNLNFSEEGLAVVISDNGKGTSIVEETGLGLKNMRERVNELNGELKISSKEKEGFKIFFTVPREKKEEF